MKVKLSFVELFYLSVIKLNLYILHLDYMSEVNNKTYLIGFILALSAGLIWSFGAPTVRYMVDAEIYQWHYLFCRGIVVATILLGSFVSKRYGSP